MGGSSLGPEVIRRSFGDIPGSPKLHVLDSTDPAAGPRGGERREPRQHALHRVVEVGRTIETLSHMKHFYERGGGDGKCFVAITDPGSSLVEEAAKRLFRRVFENDPEIGGATRCCPTSAWCPRRSRA